MAAEGWVFPVTLRKAHYQRAGRTLCGRYGGWPAIVLEPDTGRPSADDCAACRRKLDKAPPAVAP